MSRLAWTLTRRQHTGAVSKVMWQKSCDLYWVKKIGVGHVTKVTWPPLPLTCISMFYNGNAEDAEEDDPVGYWRSRESHVIGENGRKQRKRVTLWVTWLNKQRTLTKEPSNVALRALRSREFGDVYFLKVTWLYIQSRDSQTHVCFVLFCFCLSGYFTEALKHSLTPRLAGSKFVGASLRAIGGFWVFFSSVTWLTHPWVTPPTKESAPETAHLCRFFRRLTLPISHLPTCIKVYFEKSGESRSERNGCGWGDRSNKGVFFSVSRDCTPLFVYISTYPNPVPPAVGR